MNRPCGTAEMDRRIRRRWKWIGFPLTLLLFGALAGLALMVAMEGIG